MAHLATLKQACDSKEQDMIDLAAKNKVIIYVKWSYFEQQYIAL